MIHIKYKLDKSDKHGIGLFADEDLKEGQLVYTASPLLDVNLTQEQFDSLSGREKKEFQWWGYFDERSQRWHVDFDVSKFINHSIDGTVTLDKLHDETYLVASRDVKRGEEITQNYLEFECEEYLQKRGISNKQGYS
jgi:uncharacterized protein